jgi:hypothetical protein
MPMTGPERTAARNALKAHPIWTDARLDKIEARWPTEWASVRAANRWVVGRR